MDFTPDWLQKKQLMTKVMKLPYDKMTLFIYMTLNMVVGMTIGYGLANTNNMQPTFKAEFDWNESNDGWHNSVIGASYLFGLSFGAFAGGILVAYGRRKTLFISIMIGFVGCLV